jgi:carbon storage regulator
MLVLRRKVGEQVVIGETIALTVLEANGRRIRLGIEAPPNVVIWREELSASQESGAAKSVPRRARAKPR